MTLHLIQRIPVLRLCRGLPASRFATLLAIGLPGIQFIQDPLDFDSRPHHTSLDTGDYPREDDLRQAAGVMATVVYQVAMQDGLVPQSPS